MIESIKEITTADSPDIELYRTLKRPQQHREQGLFVVEGDKVVKRFFESSLCAVSVLLIPELLDFYKPIFNNRPENIKVFTAKESLLKTIVGYRYHQGIMAVGIVPSAPSLERILADSSKQLILVALDRLESSENTGVIVRNCAANGVKAIIIGERSSDPFLRRAVRNSMGTLFKMPVIYSENLVSTLQHLRQAYHFQIIAAHPRAESHPIFSVDFCINSCIVLGNEGEGISPEILQQCTHEVQIPMAPHIDSLNVACASAVILYETMRQQLSKLPINSSLS